MGSTVFVAMEEYETRRGRALSSPQRDRVLVLLRILPQRQESPLKSKHGLLRTQARRHRVQSRYELRLAYEAKRYRKWSPFGDHHLRILTTSGSGSKTPPRYQTGGVCSTHHPDFRTVFWSSRMIIDVRESSFRRNRESGSSNKSIFHCFTSDRKGSFER